MHSSAQAKLEKVINGLYFKYYLHETPLIYNITLRYVNYHILIIKTETIDKK